MAQSSSMAKKERERELGEGTQRGPVQRIGGGILNAKRDTNGPSGGKRGRSRQRNGAEGRTEGGAEAGSK